jgi:hypothetical protein
MILYYFRPPLSISGPHLFSLFSTQDTYLLSAFPIPFELLKFVCLQTNFLWYFAMGGTNQFAGELMLGGELTLKHEHPLFFSSSFFGSHPAQVQRFCDLDTDAFTNQSSKIRSLLSATRNQSLSRVDPCALHHPTGSSGIRYDT